MQLGHEGQPQYTHWQQCIGGPGATPGRHLRSQRPTTSSWSARSHKEPVFASTRRRGPRVPSFLPKFDMPRGTEVMGRSGAQPLPPSHAKQLNSARARLGSSGRVLGTPRGSTPRAALPFRAPPGQVGRIKSNATLEPLSPRSADTRDSAVKQLKLAFKRGQFSGAIREKQQLVSLVYTTARDAAEQVRKKRQQVEQRNRDAEALMTSLRNAFHTIDVDKNGTVEPAEVLGLVKSSGQQVNEANFWDNFNQVDSDHNGLIDEEEFMTILTADVRAKHPCSHPIPFAYARPRLRHQLTAC